MALIFRVLRITPQMLNSISGRIARFWQQQVTSTWKSLFGRSRKRTGAAQRVLSHGNALEDRTLLAAIVVNSLADNTTGGDGLTTLREAILAANATSGADTISFAPGLNGTINLSLGQMTLTDSVRITGNGASNTIIDAQNLSRILNITAGDVAIESLTLTRGKTTANNQGGGAIRSTSAGTLSIEQSQITASSTTGSDSDGGAILSYFGPVVVSESTLSGNWTTGSNAGGGAIAAYSGSITLSLSTLSGNSTAHINAGGGAVASNYGDVNVFQSTLSGNSTTGNDSSGGAIFSFGAVQLDSSTLSGNTTSGLRAEGGAIYASDRVITVSRSTLSGNSTTGNNASGGAIFSDGQSVTVSQSTFSGNSTAGTDADGGAIFVQAGGAILISQSTLTGNQASASVGGAIYGDTSNLTIRNSIVALNTDSGTASDFMAPTSGTVSVSYSIIGADTGTGLSATVGTTPGANGNFVGTAATPFDPKLGLLQNNGGPTLTHALKLDSPALNRGNNADAIDPTAGNAALLTDQRGIGYSRIATGTVDIGAMESTPLTSGIVSGVLTVTGTSGNNTIRVFSVGGIVKIDDGNSVTDTGILLASLTRVNLVGLGGNDLLRLDTSLGNTIIGSMQGGEGDDTLVSGRGNDTIDGGSGVDTLSYIQATAGVKVTLAKLTAQNTVGAGTDTISGIENLIGSNLNDNLTGNSGANRISGGDGNDTLNGGAGADVLEGGEGNDALSFDNLDTSVIGGNGTDTATVSGATAGVNLNLTLGQIEKASVGTSSYNNTLNAAGATWAVSLTGSNGNDTLIGGNLNDTLNGGAGNDSLVGNGGNDTLNGGTGADALDGGEGNDALSFDNLDTSVIGGNGADTATVSGATAGVNLNLTLGQIEKASVGTSSYNNTLNASGATWAVSLTGSNGNDTLIGGNLNDTLNGGAGNDSLVGNGGNDTLNGGTGADALDGGEGNDTLSFDNLDTSVIGGNGSDTANLSGATGAVNLNLTAGQIEKVSAASSTYNNILNATGATWAVSITGGSGNDTISGGNLNDTLSGGSGNDLLTGNGGNDTINGGAGSDTANYSTAGSAVIVSLVTNKSSGGAGVDTLSQIENLTGSIYNDQLTGNTGNNILHGGGGLDTIIGGGGSDSILFP